MKQVAITGANGFLGRQLVSSAMSQGLLARSLVRRHTDADKRMPDVCEMGDLGCDNLPPGLLDGCDIVIHGAARAHVLHETEGHPLSAFRRINTEGTLQLAQAAVSSGVRRFVFVSSIGVLGNHSLGRPFFATDGHAPVEDYAISKAEAEVALADLAAHSPLEVIIVRPPLVHGPGAKGNFARLLAAIAKQRPMPLGGVRNRRSFIGVANLAQALVQAAVGTFPDHAFHQGKSRVAIYHVADDGIISSRRLIEVLAEGLHVEPRLIDLPRWLVVGGASFFGKGAAARRLFADLEVDDHDFRRDFAWRPRIGLEEGLRMMAQDYLQRQQRIQAGG